MATLTIIIWGIIIGAMLSLEVWHQLMKIKRNNQNSHWYRESFPDYITEKPKEEPKRKPPMMPY